jgi:hypothetical protein
MRLLGHVKPCRSLKKMMHDLRRESPRANRSCRSTGQRIAMISVAVLALANLGCTETFDAGHTRSHGLLPVDERNPIVLINDSCSDNWQGEYAVLLANSGGPKLAGIIVGKGANASDPEANITQWRKLVEAALASNLDAPYPITSNSDKLQRPANGDIEENVGTPSEGAQLIVNKSKELSLPHRPLVVVTGGRLTDVANAYFMDSEVTKRVVVVSSLGSLSAASGGVMGDPNGEMDPWADTIVTTKFIYVQVSAFYDQYNEDVPASRLGDLPANDFTAWITAKQPGIWKLQKAADQVAVAAVGIPTFVTKVERVSAAGPVAAGALIGPALVNDPNGPLWLVREIASSEATKPFWKLLVDPKTYQR